MITIRPGDDQLTAVNFDRPLTLEQLKAGLDEGYLEAVPMFNTIAVEGVVHRCVAFCDEDGIRKELPVNMLATGLWLAACGRAGMRSLPQAYGLLGPVVIVYGDQEFMAEL